MKNYKYLPVITGLFAASLLISNTLDTKIFMLGSLALPAGIILFPIAYLFGDILTEVYGYAASRKVIWTGFASLALMVVCYEIARIIEPAPFWEYQESYEHILGKVPRIVAASITAYFFGEFTNSFVVAKMKVKSEGKGMALRFIVSTIFGQAVDTTVFVAIAFLGTMAIGDLGLIILSGWGFKVVWEVIALPISIPLVKWLKKVENEDYFDKDTDFSPFKLS
ncbi:queuosine precursor transporter [Bacteroidota bacterium]